MAWMQQQDPDWCKSLLCWQVSVSAFTQKLMLVSVAYRQEWASWCILLRVDQAIYGFFSWFNLGLFSQVICAGMHQGNLAPHSRSPIYGQMMNYGQGIGPGQPMSSQGGFGHPMTFTQQLQNYPQGQGNSGMPSSQGVSLQHALGPFLWYL